MRTKAIASAVAEAKHELKQVDSQIEALTTKREQLNSFITTGQKLTGKSKDADSPRSSEQSSRSQSNPQPNQTQQPSFTRSGNTWENAVDALKKAGHPLRPAELVDALQKMGNPVKGNFPRDQVRSAMARRPEVFEKLGPGLFGLMEWPAEVKQGKQPRLQ